LTETNKRGYLNGSGIKCQVRQKTAKCLVRGQALEVAIVDVEKAAEVIRLATATAFGNGAMTKDTSHQNKAFIFAIKQRDSRCTRWRKRKFRYGAKIDFVRCALTVLVPVK